MAIFNKPLSMVLQGAAPVNNPVNTLTDPTVNKEDVNKEDVNNRKAYMREYMRRKRETNDGGKDGS